MRRKSGRAISDAVAAPSSVPTAAAPSEDPFPSVTVPTLDLFARFQGRRDDFEASWIMMEEETAGPAKAPPISADVADKLRRHQHLLQTRRGAGASSATGTTTGPAPDRPRPASKAATVKGGEDFDRAAAAEAARGAELLSRKPPVRAPPTTRATDDDEDDEEMYVPERTDAPQYRRAAAGTGSVDVAGVLEADGVQGVGDAPVADEGKDVEEGEGEGVQGDFLTFLPRNTAGTVDNPNPDASALQATVSLRPTASPRPARAGGKSSASASSPTSPTSPTARGRTAPAVSQELVVPLWSEARVGRFGGYYPSNRLVALHQEITDLVALLRPTQAEVSIRRYVELEVRRLVKRLWPRARLMVYGSLYTHLLLPLSDVDMTLTNLPEGLTPDEALTELASAVSREGLCHWAGPQVILKTRVPLIKFQHKDSLVDIDISVNALDGKNNSDIVIHLLNYYPEARPLILVVKYFLQQRDMHEPYRGGLGSYAATLLVISFLQNHPIYTTRPAERPFTGLGKLLVDFFRYCGQCWSYSQLGVSLTGGGHYFRREDGAGGHFAPSSPTSPRSPLGPPEVLIADPLNAANNAASSLRNWHMISSFFANAYQALTAPFPTVFEACAGAGARVGTDGGGGGANSARPLSDYSPDALEVARRPTLLSRILHVDADTVYRRQSIAAAYAALVEADPAAMADVERYRAEEDAALLSGVHTMRAVPGTSTAPSSPVTREEADSIATLTAAAGKRGRQDRASSTSSTSSSNEDEGSTVSSNASSVRLNVEKAAQRRRLR